MKIEILTKRQARMMIKEEVNEKFRKELKVLWENLQKLNDRLRILENE